MVRSGSGRRGGPKASLEFGALFATLVLAAACGGNAAAPSAHPSSSGGATSSAGAAPAQGGSSESASGSDDGGSPASETCSPGLAPLRRLTRAQYSSSLSALFGDISEAISPQDGEWRSIPNGSWEETYGVHVEQAAGYARIAKRLAAHATRDVQALAELAACAAQPDPDTKCAQTTIETFASKAFRRAPTQQELEELLALHQAVLASDGNFAQATAAVITAILQAPDFLYRIEWGTDAGPRPDVRRLTGDEMASRLSYLVWGTSPDEGLRKAAQSGALLEPEGVAREAARLLDDPRSRAGLSAFFDEYLKLSRLPDLQRADPTYSSELGGSLRQATQRFLEVQIFDRNASWPSVLTADTAFVNGRVAGQFGVTGITGDEWREVALEPNQRLGLLTQPSVLMTSLSTDATNPTRRGYEILEQVLCRHLPPEDPELPPRVEGPSTTEPMTTRQRWTLITADPNCARCHRDMDQLGFAFENFDAMGRYRTQENGLSIDASANVAWLGPTNGPIELVKKLASLPETQACFSQHFAEFSLGKSVTADAAGACLTQDLTRRFEAAGFNVRQLLLELTQTDAFLYLPKDR
ncbi:MAG TPA: DUF1592 domain-containing protein [Polyangiaceae bacterium]|nr:DUF1592 domain-containing protein [Polyangiaceae bacterium]